MSGDTIGTKSQFTTIQVENLAENTTEDDVRSLFGRYGFVCSIRMLPGIANRRGYDCCYLKMRDCQAAAAISELDGKTFGGSILRVREAQAQPRASRKPQRVADPEPTCGPIQLIYEVASVEKAAPPPGMAGDDWYCYTLSSGSSQITGFHRGSCADVTAYAYHCAEEFNLRNSRVKSARRMGPPKKQ